MPSRRSFLGGALAAASSPSLGWAAAGKPSFLTAARTASGRFVLIGLCPDASIAFSIPLPGRGHAAAAHPGRAQAVAFARRPGTYAMVIDCVSGAIEHEMTAPQGRHFYGHGAFSLDGQTLFTTENEIDTGVGRIGVWDAAGGYRRIGEVASGGIGPHEIVRMPGTDTLAVANGGIRTHPDTGRDKLNLDTMRPNLTLLAADGRIAEVAELPAEDHQNSLRHIAAFADGRVACAFQWQGDSYDAPSIAGVYQPGGGVSPVPMDVDVLHGLDGYAGSIAVLNSDRMAVTYPRGGMMQVFDFTSGSTATLRQADVCGVSTGFATDGLGGVHEIVADALVSRAHHSVAFDNHLIKI